MLTLIYSVSPYPAMPRTTTPSRIELLKHLGGMGPDMDEDEIGLRGDK